MTGFRIQAHIKDGSVKLISEDGGNVTTRFPSMVRDLKVGGSRILDAEITGERAGKHIGRSKVSGYAHAKTPANDGPYTANVFDVVYLDGKDIHREPMSVRREARNGLRSTKKLNIHMGIVANTDDELKKAIRTLSKIKGSEGAMLKAMDSPYPLTGNTNRWLKAKKQWDIDAEVLEATRVKDTDAYNYLTILRGPGNEPIPLGRTFNVRFEDDRGRPIRVPVGGIIRVTFGNLNRYKDAKTGKTWYNFWSPRATEYREDRKRPTSLSEADVLVEKSAGVVAEKPYPRRYKVALKLKESAFSRLLTYDEYLAEHYPILYDLDEYDLALLHSGISEDDLAEARRKIFRDAAEDNIYWDDFFIEDEIIEAETERAKLKEATFKDIPSGGKTDSVLFEHHWRKALSVHNDHRFKVNGVLNGWTISDQPKPGEVGATKKRLGMDPEDDVDTETEAAKLEKALDWKFDPKKPEVKVLCFPKAAQPPVWLTFKGKVEPGDVGATEHGSGYFYHVQKGSKEFGTQKTHFHEYFEYGKRYYGRWLVRRIPARREWEKVGKGKLVWLAWFTKPDKENQIPYILTRRGRVKRDWTPPPGVPGISSEWMRQIPQKLKWWTDKKLTNAERLNRIDAAFNYLAENDKIPFRPIKFKEQASIPFALSRAYWRGPCLASLTRVLTPNGWKRTVDLKIGEETIGRNEQIQKIKNKSYVIGSEIVNLYLDHAVTSVTPAHPFLTKAGWKSASELTNHDFIFVPSLGIKCFNCQKPVAFFQKFCSKHCQMVYEFENGLRKIPKRFPGAKEAMKDLKVRKKISEGMKEYFRLNPKKLREQIEILKAHRFKGEKWRGPILKRIKELKEKGQFWTKLEERFAKLLKRHGVKYEYQYQIGKCWADFYLLESKTVIECDGSYWHQDKGKQIQRDFYLKSLIPNLRILHFNEDEIKEMERVNSNPLQWNCLIPVKLQRVKVKTMKRKMRFYNLETEDHTVITKCGLSHNTVVRGMPRARWELFLDLGDTKLNRWEFDQNPLTFDSVAGVMDTERTKPPDGDFKDWLTFEGEIKPAHPKNPNKRLPMTYEMEDSGKVSIIEKTEDFIHLDFKGKRMKGRRVLRREDPKSEVWLFELGAGPGEKR